MNPVNEYMPVNFLELLVHHRGLDPLRPGFKGHRSRAWELVKILQEDDIQRLRNRKEDLRQRERNIKTLMWPPVFEGVTWGQILLAGWHHGLRYSDTSFDFYSVKGVQLGLVALHPDYRPWTSGGLEEVLANKRNFDSLLESLELEHPEDIPFVTAEDIREVFLNVYFHPELSFKTLISNVAKRK